MEKVYRLGQKTFFLYIDRVHAHIFGGRQNSGAKYVKRVYKGFFIF